MKNAQIKKLGILAGLLALALGFVGINATSAEAVWLGVWTDFWNNGAYYNSNFERSGFATYLLRSDGKVGINLVPLWGDTAILPYVAYSGAYSGDPNYWNNYLYSGVGVRVLPFAKAVDPSPINALKLFYESMSASYFKDGAAAQTAGRSATDSLYGLDLWYEWNQPEWVGDKDYNFGNAWSEMWLNLAYRQTNFYENDFNSYILRFQEKTGLYVGAMQNNAPQFEPYVTLDLVSSGKTYYWLNRLSYGLGVRIQPFRYLESDESAALYKFKMFAEGLGIAYFKDVPTTTVNADFRAGVEFTIGR